MKPSHDKSLLTSNFAEYFYYFIGLSLLITITLGGSLYYYSSSVLREEAITSNTNSLTLLRNAQELVLAEVDKSMGNIFLDSFYASYMDYYKKQDMITLQMLQAKLDDVLSTNNYIDSVYIYYHKDAFVLSSQQGPVPLSDFGDKQFASELTSKTFEKSYVKTRLVKKNLKPDESVITIVKAIPIYFTGLPTAYVVINIKGMYIQQVVDSIQTNQNAGIMVADQAGNIITQKAGSNVNITNASEILQMPVGKETDYSVKKIDGVETLVSYMSSEKYGWTYIYTIPMSIVTYKIQLWARTALLFGVFVLLFSVFFSFLFSNRISSPLKRMLSLLRNDLAPEDKKQELTSLKGIKQIERNVTRILDKNRNLENMLQDYEIYSRNQFLRALLVEKEDVTAKTFERLAYYGLTLETDGSFVTCLISMDQYAKFSHEHSEKVRNTLFLQMKESLNNLVFQNQKGFILELETNQIALVLNFGPRIEISEAKQIAYAILKEAQALIAVTDAYTFTFGVSTPYIGLEQLNVSYYEATVAANYKLILGNNNIILYENMEKGEKHIAYPVSIERNLLNSLKMGDSGAVTGYFAEFETYMGQQATDHIEIVRSFFLQLFSSSITCIYEMDSDLEVGVLMQNVTYTDLLREETMHGMVAYMSNVYDQIITYLEAKRNVKNQELVDKVKAFILNHLGLDLSQERLSEQFYISSSYLRKIFKDETGETIKDFILAERMRKAKELLAHTSVKISDIAEQIGYMSGQSFSKAFKLEEGKTPIAYREEQQRVLK
ncbi:hypothetical protein A8709_25075 [Paenibacillus pectinilyticus]|uniref:HTH araC/xylS-type domain-containing protein n=1 Tax=Paenibacillus pectinilyticus TaxID=512399 RepID=A0A1C1A2A3_9BACL|nr:helix-turn-helix domain-containing protein [Paenibacillus pectinilyticus]OCT14658.1 hypothetical protein A8709_25075 [Paenibacillus pectinilyticus]